MNRPCRITPRASQDIEAIAASILDDLLAAACQRLIPYLAYNRNISDAERALCHLPPSTHHNPSLLKGTGS